MNDYQIIGRGMLHYCQSPAKIEGVTGIGIAYHDFIGVVCFDRGNLHYVGYFNINHIDRAIDKVVDLIKELNIEESYVAADDTSVGLDISGRLLDKFYRIKTFKNQLLHKTDKSRFMDSRTKLFFDVKMDILAGKIGNISRVKDCEKLIFQLFRTRYALKYDKYSKVFSRDELEKKFRNKCFLSEALICLYSTIQTESEEEIIELPVLGL